MTGMSQTEELINASCNVDPPSTTETGSDTMTTKPSLTTTVPMLSMATAVLSADGTIVVTLPPGTDPKSLPGTQEFMEPVSHSQKPINTTSNVQPISAIETGSGMEPVSHIKKPINTTSNVQALSTIETESGNMTMKPSSTTMATAVLSADGTIVVTLPPDTDPKSLLTNPAQNSKWQPHSGN